MNKLFAKIKNILYFLGFFTSLMVTTPIVQASCTFNATSEEFFTNSKTPEKITPIYRLYNKRTGVNLYTRGYDDTIKILTKWSNFEYTDNLPAFCASLTQKENLTPIYRLYNTRTGVHLYTRGEADRDKILTKYKDFEYTDSIPAFYASLVDNGTIPIYRLYNKKTGAHLYTIGIEDRDKILAKWSDFEYTDSIPAFYADIPTNSGKEIIIENLGPIISIGLHEYSKKDLAKNELTLKATAPFNILDKDDTIVGTVDADSKIYISYIHDGDFRITLNNENLIDEINSEITFLATDIKDKKTIIFDVNRPNSPFDRYRHGIRVRLAETTDTIWLINDIPLEQYVWGMGEITGTGNVEHNNVMTTAFRTYGQWKIIYSTKYAYAGFKVNATPGNQLYYGYDWEITHPRIRESSEKTHGTIVYDEHDTVAIIPYSSWTDGRTRGWNEVWNDPNDIFPHCKGVPDPYGKHKSKTTAQLKSEGNHMVGLSAHGSLSMAQDYDKSWREILNYYFSNITLKKNY